MQYKLVGYFAKGGKGGGKEYSYELLFSSASTTSDVALENEAKAMCDKVAPLMSNQYTCYKQLVSPIYADDVADAARMLALSLDFDIDGTLPTTDQTIADLEYGVQFVQTARPGQPGFFFLRASLLEAEIVDGPNGGKVWKDDNIPARFTTFAAAIMTGYSTLEKGHLLRAGRKTGGPMRLVTAFKSPNPIRKELTNERTTVVEDRKKSARKELTDLAQNARAYGFTRNGTAPPNLGANERADLNSDLKLILEHYKLSELVRWNVIKKRIINQVKAGTF